MRLPRRPVCVASLLALSVLGALPATHTAPADRAPERAVLAAAPALGLPVAAAPTPAPAQTGPRPAAAHAAPAAPRTTPRHRTTARPARPSVVPPRSLPAADAAAPAVAAPAVPVVAAVAAAGAGPAQVTGSAQTAANGVQGAGGGPVDGPRLYVHPGGPSPLLVPPGGRTQFGMSVYPLGGETAAQAVARLRGQFGALPVARVFSPGLLPASWDDEPTLRALGSASSVVYSFKADPRAVAAGTYDDRVRSFLAGRPAGVRAYVAFYHEPEDDAESGVFTPAQFRAATEHLAPVVRDSGAVPTTILMQYTLSPTSHRDWHDYYSPAVDVLAWDAYNTSAQDRVPSYRPVAGLVAPVLAVARETGKAFGWAELGSPCLTTDPTCAGRAAWLAGLGAGFAAAGAQFATYWNRPNVGGFDYTLNDAASASAWGATMR